MKSTIWNRFQSKTMYVSEVKLCVGVMYFIYSYGISNYDDNVWLFSALFTMHFG